MNSIPQFNSAAEAFGNFDLFLATIAKEPTLSLEITIEASESNGRPKFEVLVDGTLIYNKEVSAGQHIINLEHPVADRAGLVMSMKGKGKHDTIVDSNGNIIQDKYIKLLGLKINNFDVFTDYDFFYNKFTSTDLTTFTAQSVNAGFWTNSTLELEFDLPFSIWYANDSTKNSSDTVQLQYQADPQKTYELFGKLVGNLDLINK